MQHAPFHQEAEIVVQPQGYVELDKPGEKEDTLERFKKAKAEEKPYDPSANDHLSEKREAQPVGRTAAWARPRPRSRRRAPRSSTLA